MNNLPTPKPGTTYERVEAELKKNTQRFIDAVINAGNYQEFKAQLVREISVTLSEFFEEAYLIKPSITPAEFEGIPGATIGVTLQIEHEGKFIHLTDAFRDYYNV